MITWLQCHYHLGETCMKKLSVQIQITMCRMSHQENLLFQDKSRDSTLRIFNSLIISTYSLLSKFMAFAPSDLDSSYLQVEYVRALSTQQKTRNLVTRQVGLEYSRKQKNLMLTQRLEKAGKIARTMIREQQDVKKQENQLKRNEKAKILQMKKLQEEHSQHQNLQQLFSDLAQKSVRAEQRSWERSQLLLA